MARKGIRKIGRYRFIEDTPLRKKAQKRLLINIGEDAVNHFKRGFRTGGGQTDKSRGGWKKRQATKADAATGKQGSILVKGGKLRASIRVTKRTMTQIYIGSDKAYAEVHNEGGTITQVVTKAQRAYFFNMYKLTGDEKWQAFALSKTLTIEIPQREFIGHSRALETRTENRIANDLIKYI